MWDGFGSGTQILKGFGKLCRCLFALWAWSPEVHPGSGSLGGVPGGPPLRFNRGPFAFSYAQRWLETRATQRNVAFGPFHGIPTSSRKIDLFEYLYKIVSSDTDSYTISGTNGFETVDEKKGWGYQARYFYTLPDYEIVRERLAKKKSEKGVIKKLVMKPGKAVIKPAMKPGKGVIKKPAMKPGKGVIKKPAMKPGKGVKKSAKKPRKGVKKSAMKRRKCATECHVIEKPIKFVKKYAKKSKYIEVFPKKEQEPEVPRKTDLKPEDSDGDSDTDSFTYSSHDEEDVQLESKTAEDSDGDSDKDYFTYSSDDEDDVQLESKTAEDSDEKIEIFPKKEQEPEALRKTDLKPEKMAEDSDKDSDEDFLMYSSDDEDDSNNDIFTYYSGDENDDDVQLESKTAEDSDEKIEIFPKKEQEPEVLRKTDLKPEKMAEDSDEDFLMYSSDDEDDSNNNIFTYYSGDENDVQ
ncbi:nucleolin-like [Penaeus monodon]|uniref:nucleolin-like n=1 Tax=Penaeus monodon TaxID=6687 RepID=UPI0018A75CEC|nr:nucleolin-like [Penaeus monodon]